MTDDEFVAEVGKEIQKNFGYSVMGAERAPDTLRPLVLEMHSLGKSAEWVAFVLVTGLPPRRKEV